MICRRHLKGDAASEAVYSDCETYRYLLTRSWNETAPRMMLIMLNPSTATEVQNDPTIERCERRARSLGFGAIRIANLFAFRATDPRVMKAAADPVGPSNDDLLLNNLTEWRPDMILCGWGAHGAHLGRSDVVAQMLRGRDQTLWSLGLTKAGLPRHPLYIGYDQRPERWT